MLIDVGLIAERLGVRVAGLLHVGAHAAEERDAYQHHGWGPRLWVEALPDKSEMLRQRFVDADQDIVLEGAAWSIPGLTLMLHRASNGESSSLLEPTGHLESHPAIDFPERVAVTTVTLDAAVRLMVEQFGIAPTFLNLDIQGAELEAMRGLTAWSSIAWVYTEVSTRELYAGQALIGDVDGFLRARGFRRIATVLHPNLGWGDALYARPDTWRAIPLRARSRFLVAMWSRRLRIRASLARGALRNPLSRA